MTDDLEPLLPPDDRSVGEEVWDRVLAVGAGRGSDDEQRDSVVSYAVTSLAGALADNKDFVDLAAALRSSAEAEREDAARREARRLGVAEHLGTAILFLLSAHSTSGAQHSVWGRALKLRAAGFAKASAWRDPAVSELEREHRSGLGAFLACQRRLTHILLAPLADVTLYRGVRLVDPEYGVRDPALRPLSGFSLEAATAIALARNGQDRGTGTIVLLSAKVPVSRLLSTPATGIGAFHEREMVVLFGDVRDRVMIRRVA